MGPHSVGPHDGGKDSQSRSCEAGTSSAAATAPKREAEVGRFSSSPPPFPPPPPPPPTPAASTPAAPRASVRGWSCEARASITAWPTPRHFLCSGSSDSVPGVAAVGIAALPLPPLFVPALARTLLLGPRSYPAPSIARTIASIDLGTSRRAAVPVAPTPGGKP